MHGLTPFSYYVEGRRNNCENPIGKSDCYAIDVSPMTGLNEGTVYFYVRDHLGSSRLVLDVEGNIQSRFNYEPYGVELTPLGSNTTNEKYKFTGQERDYDTGMDYMHFRYYASTMGRFMKPDNMITNAMNPQSWNLYSYVNGNPVNFNDPSGHGPHSGKDAVRWMQNIHSAGFGLWFDKSYNAGWFNQQAYDAYINITWGGVSTTNAIGRGLSSSTMTVYISGQYAGPTTIEEVPDFGFFPAQNIVGFWIELEIPIPPNVNLEENMRFANRLSPFHPFAYRDLVKSGGSWDYKLQKPGLLSWENFGNLNYGATAKAWGFPNEFIFYEGAKNGSVKNGPAPYGDQWDDRLMIMLGIEFYNDWVKVGQAIIP